MSRRRKTADTSLPLSSSPSETTWEHRAPAVNESYLHGASPLAAVGGGARVREAGGTSACCFQRTGLELGKVDRRGHWCTYAAQT